MAYYLLYRNATHSTRRALNVIGSLRCFALAAIETLENFPPGRGEPPFLPKLTKTCPSLYIKQDLSGSDEVLVSVSLTMLHPHCIARPPVSPRRGTPGHFIKQSHGYVIPKTCVERNGFTETSNVFYIRAQKARQIQKDHRSGNRAAESGWMEQRVNPTRLNYRYTPRIKAQIPRYLAKSCLRILFEHYWIRPAPPYLAEGFAVTTSR